MNAKNIPPTHEGLLKYNISHRTSASVHKGEGCVLPQSLELSLRQTGEQGHVIKAPGKVTLSIRAFTSIHKQRPPKPNHKHWSNKPQFNLCTRNCGDFQMQNSSDQKMNGSLTRRLKLKITKINKWNILQVMNPYFSSFHKKELLRIKVKESDFPYNKLQFLLGFAARSTFLRWCEFVVTPY